MKRTLYALLAAGLPILFVLSVQAPVNAAPAVQQTFEPTPTPGPDGRIIYVVQANDSPWLIAAKFNLDYNELLSLNGWGPNEILQPGQEVLLGFGGPVEPTQPPAATAPPAEAVPTEAKGPGTASVCILLFEDTNGDALRQDDEYAVGGGAVSLSERTGLFSQSSPTVSGFDEDGLPYYVCYEELPQGEYNISVAVPEGYNPTTGMDLTFPLHAGDATTLNFGAQLSGQAAAQNLPVEEGGRSPLMGALGIILLLLGVGLGVFSTRMRRK